jgi:hypothetical protein
MRNLRLGWICGTLLFVVASQEMAAQELEGAYGWMQTPTLSQSSYSYQFDYRQDFTPNLGSSLAWINEGHVSGHKRDGYAWEAWLTLPTFDDRLAFSLGAGPYYFFDTQRLPGGGSTDVHGTAPVYSFTATYYTDDRWFARFTVNRITPSHDITVNSAAVGIGYWLGEGDRPEKGGLSRPPGSDAVTENELTVFAGKSVENTWSDSITDAGALEYRHGLLPHLDGTLSYIYEGDPKVIRRNGAALQIWPVYPFNNGGFTVGMGFGIYATIDQKNISRVDAYHAPLISPLVSPTVGVRLSDAWLIRATFNRVVSYDKPDADVFLLGLGFCWR